MRTLAAAACMAALICSTWAAGATAQERAPAPGAKAGKPAAQPPRYTGRDGTYAMPYPALGAGVDVRDTMINERAGWAEFRSTDGAALYVVSTRLVEGPRDARELDAVRRRYADFSRQLPERFREWSGKGRFGPSYGFTLINAEGVVGYPVKLAYRGTPDVQSAAVHRFFVQNGVLYEVAVLVQKTGPAAAFAAAQLEQRAQAQADAAIAAIELLDPAAPGPATTKPPEKK
jgi:hypothetical protein